MWPDAMNLQTPEGSKGMLHPATYKVAQGILATTGKWGFPKQEMKNWSWHSQMLWDDEQPSRPPRGEMVVSPRQQQEEQGGNEVEWMGLVWHNNQCDSVWGCNYCDSVWEYNIFEVGVQHKIHKSITPQQWTTATKYLQWYEKTDRVVIRWLTWCMYQLHATANSMLNIIMGLRRVHTAVRN